MFILIKNTLINSKEIRIIDKTGETYIDVSLKGGSVKRFIFDSVKERNEVFVLILHRIDRG